MKALDRKAPYATIHHTGAATSACYEQGGVLFDALGNEVGGQSANAPTKTLKVPAKALLDNAQVSAQLAE